MNFLKLHLESTQQYFSAPYDTAQKDTFPTESVPTANVIVGMIGRAMGLPRGHAEMDRMKEQMIIKYRNVRNAPPLVKAEFRVTRPLTRKYADIQNPNDTPVFRKMDGSTENRSQMKNIEFVQDAAYDVYVGGSDDELLKIHNALAHPYWPVYIGRAQCVPTRVIVGPNPEIIAEED
jgi:hypothetical protein